MSCQLSPVAFFSLLPHFLFCSLFLPRPLGNSWAVSWTKKIQPSVPVYCIFFLAYSWKEPIRISKMTSLHCLFYPNNSPHLNYLTYSDMKQRKEAHLKNCNRRHCHFCLKNDTSTNKPSLHYCLLKHGWMTSQKAKPKALQHHKFSDTDDSGHSTPALSESHQRASDKAIILSSSYTDWHSRGSWYARLLRDVWLKEREHKSIRQEVS